MKFNIKTYKFLKVKNYFKNSHCFFLYNTVVQKNNIINAQYFKKIELKHYKLYNSLTKLIFSSSIYKKYISLIISLLIMIFPDTSSKLVQIPHTNNTLSLIGIKINNKIYSSKQIDHFFIFNYKKNVLNLMQTLKAALTSFNFL
jgi:hypothetical protein